MSDTAGVRDTGLAPPRPVTPTTIIAADLVDVCAELEVRGGVPNALLDKLRRARDLAECLDSYLARCTTSESRPLARLAQRTRDTDWVGRSSGVLEQEMLSGHVEGQLLKFLIRVTHARRVLEVGMFTGYSALAMAEALPDDGVVVACEIDPDIARFAQECFDRSPAGHKIDVEVGPAIESLRRLAARSTDARFDFVFIDADKSGYLDYVEFLLTSDLLSPRAVIAVDNTLMQGQPYADTEISVNGAAIAGFNAALIYDPRVEQVLIPLRDGLTLIRRLP